MTVSAAAGVWLFSTAALNRTTRWFPLSATHRFGLIKSTAKIMPYPIKKNSFRSGSDASVPRYSPALSAILAYPAWLVVAGFTHVETANAGGQVTGSGPSMCVAIGSSTRDPRAALQTLEGAPEKEKGKAGYVLARNWALMANGDPGARKAVETALAAARVPETLLQDAVIKLRAGNLAGARDDLEQVLKIDPEDLRALSTLVQIHISQKQPAAALEKIRQCVVLRPNSAKLQIFLGTWLLQNHREPEGLRALVAAKAAAPGNPVPDLLSAGWDIETGKLDAARTKLT